jgi:hypothetical protein
MQNLCPTSLFLLLVLHFFFISNMDALRPGQKADSGKLECDGFDVRSLANFESYRQAKLSH